MKIKTSQTNQAMQSVHQRSYILRLWREDLAQGTGWRASLEVPLTGERFGFANLEQLFAFLMELSESDGNMVKEKKL